MNYSNILITKNKTIKDAIKKIDKNPIKILFVMEKESVVGSLTDGDIRRYILKGGNSNDSVYSAANHNPKCAFSMKEARENFNDDYIAIPIIKNRKLVDVYFGKDEKEDVGEINIPVVINAGGKGTRLEPFTKVLPKPLIPVGELPIIELIMQKFESFGCKKFYTIVNYKKQLIKAYFKECDKKYNVTCIDESNPLGTAGGLSLLKGRLKGNFFFVNCDTLLTSNYSDILKEHIRRKSVLTMVCANRKMEVPFGIVKVNSKNEFQSIKEKPSYNFLTNIGFYIVNEEVLNDLPINTKIDMPEVIDMEKKKGKKVFVYSVNEEEWLDMGEIPELERMRKTIYGE